MIEARSQYEPDIAIPPGDTLRETLEALQMSQAELARRTGRPKKTINEIVKGKGAITPDTAIHLQKALGVPARFWNNLERNYQEDLARLRAESDLQAQLKQAQIYPYNEMAKLGWLPKTRDRLVRARELLSFLGVTSFDAEPVRPQVAYRLSKGRRPSTEAIRAWLRKGELDARSVKTAPFSESAFRDALAGIRRLTREPPEKFQGKVRSLCASCGVALVFVPHLCGTYAHGAVRWLSSNRALIQLSIRYKYDDIFWFSFFHEAGHILLHNKTTIFIEIDSSPKTEEEIQADRFAANTLIPASVYRQFVSRSRFSRAIVEEFARKIGVAPSIVVGRLHHDKKIPQSYLNGMRTRFAWTIETS